MNREIVFVRGYCDPLPMFSATNVEEQDKYEHCPLRHRHRRRMRLSVAATPTLLAQAAPKTVAVNIASDPDVLGAERFFSAWMEGQIAYRGLPGIAVGVVSDQELVWATGFGFANVEAKTPMTPATKFRMASHSKLFTAIAIMQLREQGKLRLDDPVEKYLPWFKAKPAGDDDGPITIEQLLSHSSGHAARGRRPLDLVRVSDGR